MDPRAGLVVLWLSGGLLLPAAAAPAAGVLIGAAALSMDQAVKMVEQRFHARVVKAETQHDNGRTVYTLRLLNASGKVWIVHVNAADGTLD